MKCPIAIETCENMRHVCGEIMHDIVLKSNTKNTYHDTDDAKVLRLRGFTDDDINEYYFRMPK